MRYDGGLEELRRWEEVDRMQLYTVSCNSGRVGVPNDHFGHHNEDKPNEVLFPKY